VFKKLGNGELRDKENVCTKGKFFRPTPKINKSYPEQICPQQKSFSFLLGQFSSEEIIPEGQSALSSPKAPKELQKYQKLR
jgi:hypothetical protein